jgi:hypothetical protein
MKNLLVEYKGGGYDGCFWEWNYFMVDENGDFVNLISTGYRGLKDDAEDLMLGIVTGDNPSRDGITVCNLDDTEEVKQFVKAGNGSLMAKLANLHWQLEESLVTDCDICGEETAVANLIPGGYSGDGGIAISAKDLVCEDCYYKSDDSDFYAIATLKIENVTLKLGDVSKWQNGRSYYNYVMLVDDEVLFTGDDFSPSPMDSCDSLDSVMSLFSMLMIRPGDTDEEYFENYTPKQLEFVINEAEELSLYAYDFENFEQGEYLAIKEYEDDYGQPVYTVTYK